MPRPVWEEGWKLCNFEDGSTVIPDQKEGVRPEGFFVSLQVPHKVCVSAFSNGFPLLFKPVKAFPYPLVPSSKATSSEKPPGSQ